MSDKPLTQLQNIGKTVAQRLHEINITNESELKEVGAANAYAQLSKQNPAEHFPVCYYLYSLEGAIKGQHWSEFSGQQKMKLRIAAGLSK